MYLRKTALIVMGTLVITTAQPATKTEKLAYCGLGALSTGITMGTIGFLAASGALKELRRLSRELAKSELNLVHTEMLLRDGNGGRLMITNHFGSPFVNSGLKEFLAEETVKSKIGILVEGDSHEGMNQDYYIKLRTQYYIRLRAEVRQWTKVIEDQ